MSNSNKKLINTKDVELFNFFKNINLHIFDDNVLKRIAILKVFFDFKNGMAVFLVKKIFY